VASLQDNFTGLQLRFTIVPHAEVDQTLEPGAVALRLDSDHEAERCRLEKLRDLSYDVAYTKAQIVDRQKMVQLLAWEISMSEDAVMQRFAAATLPNRSYSSPPCAANPRSTHRCRGPVSCGKSALLFSPLRVAA